MSIAAIMTVWEHAHNFSSSLNHHDALRMFVTVRNNLLKEEKDADAMGNGKMKSIVSKLLVQVNGEVDAYVKLFGGNYWVALSLSPSATQAEIKKSYRKLALKHHPDRQHGDACGGADDLFPLIQNAYEVLSDANQRRKYRVVMTVPEAMSALRAAAKQSNSHPQSQPKSKPYAASSASSGHSKENFPKQGSRHSSSSSQQPPPRDYYSAGAEYYKRKAREAEERRRQRDHDRNVHAEQKRKENAERQARYEANDPTDDYYAQQQKKWERERQQQEETAWRRRMEEIRRRKTEQERQRAKKDSQAKAEAEARARERRKRDEEWRKQQEEQKRCNALKKILKLSMLRQLKASNIKDRLIALGHTTEGCLEKEDFVRKYCVVTGQVYEAPITAKEPRIPRSDFKGNESGKDDGDYCDFENRVLEMSVKQLRQFISSRNASDRLRGLVEKGEIQSVALDLYTAPDSSSKMGRTAFGKAFMNNEETEDESKKESPSNSSRPPIIRTDRLRDYERRMDPTKNSATQDTHTSSSSSRTKNKSSISNDTLRTTLEEVVNEFRKRESTSSTPVSPTFSTPASPTSPAQSKSPSSSHVTSPQSPPTPPTPPMSKDEMAAMYDRMYEPKVSSPSAEGSSSPVNVSSPPVDTEWEETTRGRDFLVNGFKFSSSEKKIGGGESHSEDEEDDAEDGCSQESDGIDWKPMTRPVNPEEMSMPMPNLGSVNLTEAEAAFIARQQVSSRNDDGEQYMRGTGYDEETKEMGGDFFADAPPNLNDAFTKTLPNWTVKEEVEFWLHGSLESDDEDSIEWTDSDDDDEGDSRHHHCEDDFEEEKQVNIETEEAIPSINQFWGHSSRT